MRTKLLLTAALVAAGIATSMAQPVYSINVVGYVNKDIPAGATLLSNPLNGTNNNLSTIIPTPPEGTLVFQFKNSIGDWDPDVTYQFTGGSWIPDRSFAPGEGFLIYAPEAFKNTFVGEVQQAQVTTPVIQEGQLLASIAPIAGPLSVVFTNAPAEENDLIFFVDRTGLTSEYEDPSSQFIGGTWIPDTTVNLCDAVLWYRNGAAGDWVRQFTVK